MPSPIKWDSDTASSPVLKWCHPLTFAKTGDEVTCAVIPHRGGDFLYSYVCLTQEFLGLSHTQIVEKGCKCDTGLRSEKMGKIVRIESKIPRRRGCTYLV